MGLREDVKFMLENEWEPQVPKEKVILEQAKKQIKIGKSSGSVRLDMNAIKALKDEEQER